MSTAKRRLFDRLRAFYNDKDFVIGVTSNVATDENCQRIMDFMDAGDDVSAESIIALSVLLDHVVNAPSSE